MATLVILTYPDERLYHKAIPVEKFDEELKRFVQDMIETMYDAKGIGLAATQVGDLRRIIVMDISEDRNQPQVFINPVITLSQDTMLSEEGCLSIPGIYDKVERAAMAHIRAYDAEGKVFECQAKNLMSACIQHEVDHLDGQLFIQKLSLFKQNRIQEKIAKRSRLEKRV